MTAPERFERLAWGAIGLDPHGLPVKLLAGSARTQLHLCCCAAIDTPEDSVCLWGAKMTRRSLAVCMPLGGGPGGRSDGRQHLPVEPGQGAALAGRQRGRGRRSGSGDAAQAHGPGQGLPLHAHKKGGHRSDRLCGGGIAWLPQCRADVQLDTPAALWSRLLFSRTLMNCFCRSITSAENNPEPQKG